jgi:hypothetical protein
VYEIGDIIMLKEMAETPGKFNMRWEGPYTVTEKKQGNVNYKIVSEDGKKRMVVHADRMKKFQGHASLEATAQAQKQKPRKRARFVEKENTIAEPNRYNLRNKIQMPQRYRN